MTQARKIADATADEEHWLEARKSLLTSSELFTWLGDVPSWWGDRPEDVIAGKRGTKKVFDPEVETSIAHGSFSEQDIMNKFGYAAGLETKGENGLFVSDKFPYIGASIDGWVRPCLDGEVHPEFSQDRTLLPYIHDYVNTTGVEALCEIKKSTSSKWQKEVPEYYVTQVKTQLAVLDVPYAVIVADTIKRGDWQKWRWFFDMRAYIIERDPAWDAMLLREGEKFAEALDAAGGPC